MVTPEEKRAVKVVAAFKGMTESQLCRSTPLDDVIVEFEEFGLASKPAA